jgi:hypothetical protein
MAKAFLLTNTSRRARVDGIIEKADELSSAHERGTMLQRAANYHHETAENAFRVGRPIEVMAAGTALVGLAAEVFGHHRAAKVCAAATGLLLGVEFAALTVEAQNLAATDELRNAASGLNTQRAYQPSAGKQQ